MKDENDCMKTYADQRMTVLNLGALGQTKGASDSALMLTMCVLQMLVLLLLLYLKGRACERSGKRSGADRNRVRGRERSVEREAAQRRAG